MPFLPVSLPASPASDRTKFCPLAAMQQLEVPFFLERRINGYAAAGLPFSRLLRVSVLALARLHLVRSTEQIGDPAA
jgi:hypothetical protein